MLTVQLIIYNSLRKTKSNCRSWTPQYCEQVIVHTVCNQEVMRATWTFYRRFRLMSRFSISVCLIIKVKKSNIKQMNKYRLLLTTASLKHAPTSLLTKTNYWISIIQATLKIGGTLLLSLSSRKKSEKFFLAWSRAKIYSKAASAMFQYSSRQLLDFRTALT